MKQRKEKTIKLRLDHNLFNKITKYKQDKGTDLSKAIRNLLESSLI